MTTNSTSQPTTEQNTSTKRTFSTFDGVCIAIIIALLGIGITLSRTNQKTPAFGISVLFGSAISLLTYHFLGGINKDEASLETGLNNTAKITLGGSIAALVGTTLISNYILEQQMNPISLIRNPSERNFVIINQEGKSIEKMIISSSSGGQETQEVIEISPQMVQRIAEMCLNREGFCTPEVRKVEFKINPQLDKTSQGNSISVARVCERQKWENKPLLLLDINQKYEPVLVDLIRNKPCLSTQTTPVVEISQATANILQVEEGDQGLAEVSLGYINVPINQQVSVINP